MSERMKEINKLHEMLSSKDEEIRDLALSIMEKKDPYWKDFDPRSFKIQCAVGDLISEAYHLGLEKGRSILNEWNTSSNKE